MAAATLAMAKADALEGVDGGEGGSSGAAGPSAVSEVAVPDQYMCSITAEIMTDPVSTVRLSTLDDPPAPRSALHVLTAPLPVERDTGGWLHVRAQRHRAVAQDPQHLARDGPRAGEQAA